MDTAMDDCPPTLPTLPAPSPTLHPVPAPSPKLNPVPPPHTTPPPAPAGSDDTDNPDDWKAFREWLVSERGVGRRTASTAASQVRRVLRDAVEVGEDGDGRVTRASLLRWYEAQDAHKRTPIASNWRRYREWWASRGVTGIPDFPRRSAGEDTRIPGEVAEALAALQASGVSMPVLSKLRWSPVARDGSLWSALAATTPGLLDGSLVALHSDTGIALLPVALLRPIFRWGHAGQPEPGAPLVPEAPGAPADHDGMPLTRMRRLARRGRTA